MTSRMPPQTERRDSDEYLTPPNIAACCDYFFGGAVDYDPYGHSQQLVKAKKIRTWETRDEPFAENIQSCFSNPPFSKTKFLLRDLAHKSFQGFFDCVVLVQAMVASEYWAQAVWSQSHVGAIGFMKRQSFYRPGPDGTPVKTAYPITRDTALIYYCPDLAHVSGDRTLAYHKLHHFKTAFKPVCRVIIKPELV